MANEAEEQRQEALARIYDRATRSGQRAVGAEVIAQLERQLRAEPELLEDAPRQTAHASYKRFQERHRPQPDEQGGPVFKPTTVLFFGDGTSVPQKRASDDDARIWLGYYREHARRQQEGTDRTITHTEGALSVWRPGDTLSSAEARYLSQQAQQTHPVQFSRQRPQTKRSARS